MVTSHLKTAVGAMSYFQFMHTWKQLFVTFGLGNHWLLWAVIPVWCSLTSQGNFQDTNIEPNPFPVGMASCPVTKFAPLHTCWLLTPPFMSLPIASILSSNVQNSTFCIYKEAFLVIMDLVHLVCPSFSIRETPVLALPFGTGFPVTGIWCPMAMYEMYFLQLFLCIQ
jgi:hypothetical protein